MDLIPIPPAGFDRLILEKNLSEGFVYFSEGSKKGSYVLYDSFDWRLFEQDLALSLEESRLNLINLTSGAVIQSQAVTGEPDFVWNLPSGELRRILEPVLEMRALINLAEFYKSVVDYRILNRNEKTVARLSYVEVAHTDSAEQTAYLQVRGVRGYPRYLQAIEEYCQNAGFTFSSRKDLFRRLFETGGTSPGDYSPKLNFQLEPEMRSDEATVVILKFLLEIMRRNEQGIKEDIDTEFLHDFRVAVRRTRSALKEIHGVFPAEITDRF